MKNKKIFKVRNNKFVTGVCGGLGKYFGIDATIIRLIYAVIMVLTGFLPMIIFYIIASFVMPYEDEINDNIIDM